MAQLKSSNVTSTKATLTYTMTDYTPYKNDVWYFGINRYTSSTSISNVTQTTVTPANSVSKTYSNLNPGYSYEGYVSIQGSEGIKLETYHKFLTKPNTPTITISNIGTTSVKISWSGTGGATGCHYTISNVASGDLGVGETVTIKNLSPGTKYTVEAYMFAYHHADSDIYKAGDSVTKTFKTEINTYTVQAINKTTAGISSVSPSSEYEAEEDEEVTFLAKMNKGYIFRGWYTSSSSTSNSYLETRNNPYTVSISEDLTLYARAELTSVSATKTTSDSITVKLSVAYSNFDYYINVYDVTNKEDILEGKSLTYSQIYTNGYQITGLKPNTQYAINVGYKSGSESGINWIWPDGNAMIFTTNPAIAYVTARTYVQGANGSYSTYYDYDFTFDLPESANIQTWANTIYNNYLVDDLADKLYENISFAYMTTELNGTQITSGYYSPTKEGNFTVYFYFKRTTYYMTLAATTGVNNFTINNVSFNTGQKLSFLYEQSISIKANLSSDYEFTKWTTNPTTITAAHNKTSNPLTFTMPASNFTITANATYKVVYYDVKLYCYYENADNGGVSGGLVDTLSYASGTSFVVSDYKNTYLKTGFYFSMAQDGDTNAIGSSITITEDTDIEFYYKRNVWVLTLKGGTGVSSFTVNGNTGYASGSTLSYKYEQSITIQAIFASNYGLDYWSSSQFSGLSGNPISVKMPNQNATITAYAKVGIADWEWTSAEIAAFTGKGRFSVLTAARWNEFLDWCNEVLAFKGKTTIGSSYYGTKGEPLYASDFNYIIDRLETVATISSAISSTKSKGDIIKGSYFIDIANAMNNVI